MAERSVSRGQVGAGTFPGTNIAVLQDGVHEAAGISGLVADQIFRIYSEALETPVKYFRKHVTY